MLRPGSVLMVVALSAPLAPAMLGQLRLQPIGTYSTGIFDASGAEIASYDPQTRRLFTTNVGNASVDIIDISNPAAPRLVRAISVLPYGAVPNSTAVRQGVVAVAVEAIVRQDPGKVVFLNTDGQFLSQVTVGALPDMLLFTPDGRRVLVANEGEPNALYTVDPEGTVSIIDVSRGAASVTQADVRTATFRSFARGSLDPSVRVYGPNASVAQDFEPEYITVSADSRTAYVTLQENNAIAVLDIEAGNFTRVVGLGFKDYRTGRNALDASDQDRRINIANWPVFGMYQPDSIASYRLGTTTYLLTANEGDDRTYGGFEELARVGQLRLDPTAFPDAATLQQPANLGRLLVTNALGDTDGDGDFDRLYTLGARSFSIWTDQVQLVYDSGADFERITAAQNPANFNSDHQQNSSFDTRSDNRGPEPEGITVGQIGDRFYAFITLERISGVMVYDVTTPTAPRFVTYVSNRDFAGNPNAGTAGDLGPEGALFIPGSDSPTGRPLLVITNEISGTATIWSITVESPAPRVNTGGLVSSADFGPRVAPGGIVSIFGTGMALSTQITASLPLPGLMNDTRVTMDGIDLPLIFVSPQQINAQLPFELEGRTTAALQVTVLGVASATINVPLAPVAPGIYTQSADGRGPGAFIRIADFSPITANSAIPREEAFAMFVTGLGAVSPPVASGAAAPASPLSETTQRPTLLIGGVAAPVLSSTLAPGFAGLYQINATVPANAPTGSAVTVVVQSGGVSSNSATIAIR